MSSLQWSLLIGAMALIAAVLLLNGLQQWKRRSRSEKTLEALREVVRSRKSTPDTASPTDASAAKTQDALNERAGSASALGELDRPTPGSHMDALDRQASASRLEAKDRPASASRLEAQDRTPVQRLERQEPKLAPDRKFRFSGTARLREPSVATGPTEADGPMLASSSEGLADSATARTSDSQDRPSMAKASVSSAEPEASIARAAASFKESDASMTESLQAQAQAQPSAPEQEAFDLKQWTRSKPWVGIDERVDLIVGLDSWQGWQGERLLQAFQGLRRVGTKPLLLEAQVLSDPQQTWVAVVPGLRFVRLRMGLLLANRSGALKPTEYSDFLSALQSVRDLLQASWTDGAAPLSMHEVLERARRVDSACAALDAQVVINLALGEPLSTAVFSRMGMSLGLIDRGNTRQSMLTAQGLEIFSMILGPKPDWITFMLDVPRAPMEETPWQKMMDCAAAAVGRFGGQLLDDNGQVLEVHQLADIGRQVLDRQQQLINAGYAPGSPLALRLFN
ncbi:MAG: hypothetical protein EBW20_04100 [Betaproteobacteria bacterium]|nr:hypothetical protein [Betaproteobacteria bacterium]NDB10701.1 hypothetical protein [Betaproteobacteria bacterium]